MQKIGIASKVYMADGGFLLTVLSDAQLRAGTRRVSRTKTLDGGVVITDSGFSHGDRTLSISIPSSASLWARLWAFFQAALLITISIDDGCFSGAPDNIQDNGDKIIMNILVKEKISA
jgi:hypothetical protein